MLIREVLPGIPTGITNCCTIRVFRLWRRRKQRRHLLRTTTSLARFQPLYLLGFFWRSDGGWIARVRKPNRLSPSAAASLKQEKTAVLRSSTPSDPHRAGARPPQPRRPPDGWLTLLCCLPTFINYLAFLGPLHSRQIFLINGAFAGALQGVTCRCGDRNVRAAGERSWSRRGSDWGGSRAFHSVSSAATCPRVSSFLVSFSCPQIPFSSLAHLYANKPRHANETCR